MAGVSIDDFGASFIDYLPGVTESLNNVYKAGEEIEKLDPVLEQMQGASIAREEW